MINRKAQSVGSSSVLHKYSNWKIHVCCIYGCTKRGGRDSRVFSIRYLLLYTTRVTKVEKYRSAASGMDSKEYSLRRLCMFPTFSYSNLSMHVCTIHVWPCNAYRKGKPAFLNESTSLDCEDLIVRKASVHVFWI